MNTCFVCGCEAHLGDVEIWAGFDTPICTDCEEAENERMAEDMGLHSTGRWDLLQYRQPRGLRFVETLPSFRAFDDIPF